MRTPDVLELTGASPPTLFRWMRKHPKLKPIDNSLVGHPFPRPTFKDGRSLIWDDDVVLDWWDANKKLIGRYTEQQPMLSFSHERWGAFYYELTRDTKINEQLLRSIKKTITREKVTDVFFDTVRNAILFKQKYDE